MRKLFAYGTLQLPEVMRAVTGRDFPARPARLPGYARRRLRGRSFPGICPAPGASADGLLFDGIDAQTLARLDAFEDDFYRRETLPVFTPDGAAWAAEVYVIRAECLGLLLPEEWSLDEFRRSQLQGFLLRHE